MSKTVSAVLSCAIAAFICTAAAAQSPTVTPKPSERYLPVRLSEVDSGKFPSFFAMKDRPANGPLIKNSPYSKARSPKSPKASGKHLATHGNDFATAERASYALLLLQGQAQADRMAASVNHKSRHDQIKSEVLLL